MNTLFELFRRFLQKISSSRVDFEDGSYIEYVAQGVIMYGEKDGHQMYARWCYEPKFRTRRTIYASDISSWLAPHKEEPVSPAKHEEIVQKILQYAKKGKVSLEIQK